MNEIKRLRVLLADDHRMLREALRLVLEPECEIVGEAASGEDAVAIALKTRPDVVVLDLSMPGIGGLEAAHQLAKQAPASKILILSQYEDDEYVIEALGRGHIAGYLTKADAASELMQAVRAVHAGKRYLGATVTPAVINRLKPSGKPAPISLTPRERQVLKLVSEGSTSKVIASRLKISPKTAQIHRANLMAKLGVHSTAAMVRYAIKHKLVRT
ncbi:MAG: response regulator transcription factor [Candidatus Binataceae bacterium]|jgi:DNA-binding NarL/FixJ family response regulator